MGKTQLQLSALTVTLKPGQAPGLRKAKAPTSRPVAKASAYWSLLIVSFVVMMAFAAGALAHQTRQVEKGSPGAASFLLCREL
jgi:hypothetical protein